MRSERTEAKLIIVFKASELRAGGGSRRALVVGVCVCVYMC